MSGPSENPIAELPVLRLSEGGATPGRLADLAADYAALTQAVGVTDDRDHEYFEVTGPDRGGFLNRFCTNRVDRLTVGTGREAFFTDVKGHILSHATIFSRPDALQIRTGRGQASPLIAHLERYVVRERVAFQRRGEPLVGLLVAGPQAAKLLARLANESPPDDYLSHAETRLEGHPVQVYCLAGEPQGVYLLTMSPESDVPESIGSRESLLAAGVRPCGALAWDAFRIESGWPLDGTDISLENLPQEVGRDRQAISFAKGCYLGQETVARIDSRGHVNRLLVGMVFKSRQIPAMGMELRSRATVVGRVTSAAYSPRTESVVALGYVRRGCHEPGTSLDSAAGPAAIVPLPMR